MAMNHPRDAQSVIVTQNALWGFQAPGMQPVLGFPAGLGYASPGVPAMRQNHWVQSRMINNA